MLYKRIMIFGRPGSRKSTFAHELHQLTNIPLYHLDKYFFTANWVERDYKAFMHDQQEMVNSASWIIDGNSTKSLETRYEKADLCLYFNFSRILCLSRILFRIFKDRSHLDDRADECDEVGGIPESIDFRKYLEKFFDVDGETFLVNTAFLPPMSAEEQAAVSNKLQERIFGGVNNSSPRCKLDA